MASVYKASGRAVYSLKFTDQHGVQRRVSSGTRDKRVAEALAAKLESDVSRLRVGLQPEHDLVTGPYLGLSMMGRSWREFRDEYTARILSARAPQTRRAVLGSFDALERAMSPRFVSDITTDALDQFVTVRRGMPGTKGATTMSEATINKDLRHLKAALKVAVEWGYLRVAPRVRMTREARHLRRYMLPDHFAAVYDACDVARRPNPCETGTPGDWWRGLLVTLYMTGWRIGQALSLRRDAADLDGGTALAFHAARDTKGKRDSLVPLHPLVVEHLRRLQGESECLFAWRHNRSKLYPTFRAIQERAGIRLPCHGDHVHTPACHVYGFHDLRRAFATLNADGMTAQALQTLMQHKSFSTTLGYIDVARQLAPAVPKLFVPPIQRSEDQKAAN